jgi:hypothetical protein
VHAIPGSLEVKRTVAFDPGHADALGETTTGLAARILRCDPRTLYAMRDRGEIECSLTPAGRHLWKVRAYLARLQTERSA